MDKHPNEKKARRLMILFTQKAVLESHLKNGRGQVRKDIQQHLQQVQQQLQQV